MKLASFQDPCYLVGVVHTRLEAVCGHERSVSTWTGSHSKTFKRILILTLYTAMDQCGHIFVRFLSFESENERERDKQAYTHAQSDTAF